VFVSPENWGDAEKYFHGCFIKVREYGDVLVRIDKVTPEALWGEDENGEGVCIEIDGKQTGKPFYELDYVLPRKAFFQYGANATLLFRTPARMWKKGINKQNTNISSLLEDGNWKARNLDFNYLKAYVNKPGYVPFNEFNAYDSIALSSRFAMTKGGQIYIDLVNIGKYYKKENTVICKKLFAKDIANLFPGVKVAKG
jgi:hypothetical protein